MPDRNNHRLRTRLADIGMVVFGMIMAVTPLALWVAPTEPWFYFVIELFVFSSVAVWYLSGFETTAAEHQSRQKALKSKATLSDKFVKKLQNMRILTRDTLVRKEISEELHDLSEKHRSDIRSSRRK